MAIITTDDWFRVDSTKRTYWRSWLTYQVTHYQDNKVRTYTWDCNSGEEPSLQNPETLLLADGWTTTWRGCQIQRGDPTGIYTEIWEQEGTIVYV